MFRMISFILKLKNIFPCTYMCTWKKVEKVQYYLFFYNNPGLVE